MKNNTTNTDHEFKQLTDQQTAVIGLLFFAALAIVSTIVCAITNSLN